MHYQNISDNSMFHFDVIESIKSRRSVRTFDAERFISLDLSIKIMDYAHAVKNPFGCDKVNINMTENIDVESGKRLGTYGVIKNAKKFLTLCCVDNERSLLAGGYQMESVVLYANSLGLGTVWLGATFNRSRFASAVCKGADRVLPAVVPIGYSSKTRFTERIMRAAVNSNNRKPWDKLFFDKDVLTPLTRDSAGKFADVLEMVRLAPSATNTQPWRIVRNANGDFDVFGDWSDRTKGTELRMRYLDMGIAVCHFDLAAHALGLKGAIVVDSENRSRSVPTSYNYIASWRI